MARRTRIEIEGGLYHVITRGNNRQDIFHDERDREKFLSLLTRQKERLPFFLYAFCLMSNHIHLLIERRADDIGRIMHRVLTGYRAERNRVASFQPQALIAAVELVLGVPRENLCGRGKLPALVRAKVALIVVGRRSGATVRELAEITNLNTSTVSRRHDDAKRRYLRTKPGSNYSIP